VRSVVEEIRVLQERYGERIGRFYFWDDILISDSRWAWEFCDTLLRENLDIQWTCNCHVSRVEPRLMFRMKQAGCVNVRFGIESGSQKILDALNKGVKVEEALQALRICLEAGLDLTLYIMVGMTGECRETIDETLSFFRMLIQPSCAHQIASINFFMLTPFPGTRLFEMARKVGRIPNLAEFLERDCDAYDDIPLNLSGQADEALVELKQDLESGVLRILGDARNQMNSLLVGMVEELRR
jgi:anaerobic magnesium-protoporphyrin IX monomethyl ester cyclase